MIDYFTIKKAKSGNILAQNEIINYYLPIIKSFSKSEDFVQNSLLAILEGIHNFKNYKK